MPPFEIGGDSVFANAQNLATINPDAFAQELYPQLQLDRYEPFGIGDIPDLFGQAIQGFMSGWSSFHATPFGEPENLPETIAYNIGSVLGFMGLLPARGLRSRARASALGRTLGLGNLFKNAPVGKGVLHVPSVPFMIADKIMEGATKIAPRMDALKFIKNERSRTMVLDMFKEGTRLGLASGVASWQEGVPEMVNNALLGGIEGVGFRALSNYADIGKLLQMEGAPRQAANALLRTVSSSIYSGVLAKSYDPNMPPELEIYHYLLGAVFGATDDSYERRRANLFMRDYVYGNKGEFKDSAFADATGRMFAMEELPQFKDEAPGVQEELRNQQLMAGLGRATLPDGTVITEQAAITGRIFDDHINERLSDLQEFGEPEDEAAYEAGIERLRGDMPDIYKQSVEEAKKIVNDLKANQEFIPLDTKTKVESMDNFFPHSTLFKATRLQEAMDSGMIMPTLQDPIVELATKISEAKGIKQDHWTIAHNLANIYSDVLTQHNVKKTRTTGGREYYEPTSDVFQAFVDKVQKTYPTLLDLSKGGKDWLSLRHAYNAVAKRPEKVQERTFNLFNSANEKGRKPFIDVTDSDINGTNNTSYASPSYSALVARDMGVDSFEVRTIVQNDGYIDNLIYEGSKFLKRRPKESDAQYRSRLEDYVDQNELMELMKLKQIKLFDRESWMGEDSEIAPKLTSRLVLDSIANQTPIATSSKASGAFGLVTGNTISTRVTPQGEQYTSSERVLKAELDSSFSGNKREQLERHLIKKMGREEFQKIKSDLPKIIMEAADTPGFRQVGNSQNGEGIFEYNGVKGSLRQIMDSVYDRYLMDIAFKIRYDEVANGNLDGSGLSYQEITAIAENSKGVFLKTPIEKNKRDQINNDKGGTMDREMYRDLPFYGNAIYNDEPHAIIISTKHVFDLDSRGLEFDDIRIGPNGQLEMRVEENGKIVWKPDDTYLDGVMLEHPDIFNAQKDDIALPRESGSIKASTNYATKEHGQFIGKYAVFGMDNLYKDLVEELTRQTGKPVAKIYFSSAAKATGLRGQYSLTMRNGKLEVAPVIDRVQIKGNPLERPPRNSFDIPTASKPSPVKMMGGGGQINGDMPGLIAAKRLGLETGGIAPFRFNTADGINTELRDVYGLTEGPDTGSWLTDYIERTKMNVDFFDGTVVALQKKKDKQGNFLNYYSSGSLKTIGYSVTKNWQSQRLDKNKHIEEFGDGYKPVLVIKETASREDAIRAVREFTHKYGIEKLNVAGSRTVDGKAWEEILVEALKGEVGASKMQAHGRQPIVKEYALDTQPFRVPFEGVRFNRGSSPHWEDAFDINIYKQIYSNIDDPAVARSIVRNIFFPALMGSDERNREFDDYRFGNSDKMKSFKLREIGLPKILELLTKQSELKEWTPAEIDLHKRIVQQIIRLDSAGEIEHMPDEKMAKKVLERLDDQGAADAMLRAATDVDLLTPATINMLGVNHYWSRVLKSYIVDRITRPQIENSALAVMAPGHFSHKGDIGFLPQTGKFYLSSSMREMKVRFIKDYASEELHDMTLGEAWDFVEKGRGDFKQARENRKKATAARDRLVDALKKTKDKTTRNKLQESIKKQVAIINEASKVIKSIEGTKSAVENMLNFTVIRAPASSASGIRQLQFGGFVESHMGNNIILSPMDMKYLGGADLDIDKAAIFQDLDRPLTANGDRPLKDYFNRKEIKWQWHKNHDPRNVFKDSKVGKWADEIIAKPDTDWYMSRTGSLSSRAKALVHRGATIGQSNIGPGATMGQRMIGLVRGYGGQDITMTPSENLVRKMLPREVLANIDFAKTMEANRKVVRVTNNLDEEFEVRRSIMDITVDSADGFGINWTRNDIGNFFFRRLFSLDTEPISQREAAKGKKFKNDHFKLVYMKDGLDENGKPKFREGEMMKLKLVYQNGNVLEKDFSVGRRRLTITDFVFGDGFRFSPMDNIDFESRPEDVIEIMNTGKEFRAGLQDAYYMLFDQAARIGINYNQNIDGKTVADVAPYASKRVTEAANFLHYLYNHRDVQRVGSVDSKLGRLMFDMVFQNAGIVSQLEGEQLYNSLKNKDRFAPLTLETFHNVTSGIFHMVAADKFLKKLGDRANDKEKNEMLRAVAEEILKVKNGLTARKSAKYGRSAMSKARLAHNYLPNQSVSEILIQSKSEIAGKYPKFADAIAYYYDRAFLSSIMATKLMDKEVLTQTIYKDLMRSRGLKQGREGVNESIMKQAEKIANDEFKRTKFMSEGFSSIAITDAAKREYLWYYNAITQKGFFDGTVNDLLGDVAIPGGKKYMEEQNALLEKAKRSNFFKDEIIENLNEKGQDSYNEFLDNMKDRMHGRKWAELMKSREFLDGVDVNFDPNTREGQLNLEFRQNLKTFLDRYPNMIDQIPDLFESITGVTPTLASRDNWQHFFYEMGVFDKWGRAERFIQNPIQYFTHPETIAEVLAPHDFDPDQFRVKFQRVLVHADDKTPTKVEGKEGGVLDNVAVVDKFVRAPFTTFNTMHRMFSLIGQAEDSDLSELSANLVKLRERIRGYSNEGWKELFELSVIIREGLNQGDKAAKRAYEDALPRIREIYNQKFTEGGKAITGMDVLGTPAQPGRINAMIDDFHQWMEDRHITTPEKERFVREERGVKTGYDLANDIVRHFLTTGKFDTAFGMEQMLKASTDIAVVDRVAPAVMNMIKTFEESGLTIDKPMQQQMAVFETPKDAHYWSYMVSRIYQRALQMHGPKFSQEDLVDTMRSMNDLLPKYSAFAKGNYWPHINKNKKQMKEFVQQWAEDLMDSQADIDFNAQLFIKYLATNDFIPDGAEGDWLRQFVLRDDLEFMDGGPPMYTIDMLDGYRPGNLKERTINIPVWQRDINVLEEYGSKIIKGKYNHMRTIVGKHMIGTFEQRNVRLSPEAKKKWKNLMMRYLDQSMGRSGRWSPEMLQVRNQELQEPIYKMAWLPYLDDVAEKAVAKMFPSWYANKVKYDPRGFQRFLSGLSQIEQRYQLLTLLASVKSATNDWFGGSLQTIQNAGFKYWWNAGRPEKLNFALTDPVLRKLGRNPEFWNRLVERHGGMESFFIHELGGNIGMHTIDTLQKLFRELDANIKTKKDLENYIKKAEAGEKEGVEEIKFRSDSPKYNFLSNFHDVENPIVDDMGLKYKNVEGYYQAQKSTDRTTREAFTNMSGAKAKARGKKIELREGWDNIKEGIMAEGVRQKFENNPDLMTKLNRTRKNILLEDVGDSFWGIGKDGEGENRLGNILMEIRNDSVYDSGPDYSDAVSLMKEIGNGVIDVAGWMKRLVEYKTRRRSWIAHYLKARETYGANGLHMEYDHPLLIDMANKGVAATQFLYDNINKPEYMRSKLGGIFTRFQTWTFNAMRFRYRAYKEAMAMGINPNTPEYQKFERTMAIDMFMMMLASIFPATIFESTLPPPFAELKDMSEVIFGGDLERNLANPQFFGPTQRAFPPASRIPVDIFRVLLTGDMNRFLDYHLWTWFPFGPQARNVYKTINNPSMVIEYNFGLPIHRLSNQVKKARESETYKYGAARVMQPNGDVLDSQDAASENYIPDMWLR